MTAATPTIAVLGTGTMGAPIARDLLRAGYRVQVWNRTPKKAASLVAEGAQLKSSPAKAAAGAEVLITMLTDGLAVKSVMSGPAGALAAFGPDTIWVQMSTVGVEWSDHLAEFASRHGVTFVDAPVSGSSQPAAEGQLLIMAAAPAAVRSHLQPIFDVLGRRTVWLERVGDGSRLKLVINNWMVVMVEGMAETLSLTTALGLKADFLLDTIADGPMASDYAIAKGAAMVDRNFVPGFPLRHATKDAALALRAAQLHQLQLPLTAALLARWHEAIADGYGDDDIASAITATCGLPRHQASA
ncbi:MULTISPECIES: NAD(P)-dependent oxidoreductase [unclassified Mycolicibacterium]|uniref:NAD(P)-dependent oxidoreductase n=1 Tax=unclassified Mycolicibacterium TaxID=2636767 RepID=UPI0012DDFD93|nr:MULTISPECIES: NAD(P)-dependent oxidoreductase [unclassified Mycolicibacterium]MUL85320.1 NAD(P)-dependent oxidoreductase [Mycolicibacterium sp. CBMA 329]MUL91287.1 NAD(P)-dependent oxidoreductase [Mycolicibacterium sp. CBMA 331]MUM02513.1 NAD(P)-dependent oxidoreductase [Mycolicibacterium sp. CBMA 334]MUM29315.1 NAD(P)-dependent oxidoreductase [Mycolicibacterium sp. CBMA 295]MUM41046.1 NAD(P)-dependent oxidoreductase [Mycolicibacterium sp. CBMA 247]